MLNEVYYPDTKPNEYYLTAAIIRDSGITFKITNENEDGTLDCWISPVRRVRDLKPGDYLMLSRADNGTDRYVIIECSIGIIVECRIKLDSPSVSPPRVCRESMLDQILSPFSKVFGKKQ